MLANMIILYAIYYWMVDKIGCAIECLKHDNVIWNALLNVWEYDNIVWDVLLNDWKHNVELHEISNAWKHGMYYWMLANMI